MEKKNKILHPENWNSEINYADNADSLSYLPFSRVKGERHGERQGDM